LRDGLEDVKTQFVKYHYIIISAMERSKLYTRYFDLKNLNSNTYYLDSEMNENNNVSVSDLSIEKIYLVYENGESTDYYVYKNSNE
jgi:hypothetical protein